MSRRLFYFVQPLLSDGPALQAGEPRAYPSAVAAEQAGEALSRRVAGVLVYMMEGDPELGDWSEPELLALHGRAMGGLPLDSAA